MKGMYRLITGVDRQVGRIVAELERQGFDDNTVVIFTGDNGIMIGEHGLTGIWLMYEGSIMGRIGREEATIEQVGLLMSGVGEPEGAAAGYAGLVGSQEPAQVSYKRRWRYAFPYANYDYLARRVGRTGQTACCRAGMHFYIAGDRRPPTHVAEHSW